MKVILIGHYNTAISMKKAVEMIVGETEDFYPITFLPNEGLDSLKTKIDDLLEKFDKNEEVLAIADLYSGTPYNAVATKALENKITDVISGMSLPICLEVAMNKKTMSVKELVNLILQNSKEYTKALSKSLTEQDEEEF
ncbi:MAG: PTS sugar transporter subunit IIA [Liquorilactobacillus hordei]|uniref:PTS sugar transporter subunit IIA n=1 Tax=Liquorilactobacillus hordei TaxID=468911 RepID=UPI0039ED6807